jgi:hypothetical protein
MIRVIRVIRVIHVIHVIHVGIEVDEIAKAYPAHLHIDILSIAQNRAGGAN